MKTDYEKQLEQIIKDRKRQDKVALITIIVGSALWIAATIWLIYNL